MKSRSMLLRWHLIVVLFVLFSFSSYAQHQVTGVVYDGDSIPLPGAAVLVKNTSIGTATDFDGKFSIQANTPNDTLLVSFVGLKTSEIPIRKKKRLTIYLGSNLELKEVVVTALGVEREEKALGYSVTKLDAADVSTIKTNNVTNQLAGKAPGVYVTGGSSGPTASSNIQIRGASSLLGNNQPLFVVNGMPITNDLYSFDDGLNGSSTIDFGNAAQVVNADDIKSMNVLKGPAASALYGSRAANGVILIETKTGEQATGLGIEVNNSLMFESVLKLPDYQNTYGFGGGGKYSYLNGSNYIGDKEYYEAYGENWGPEMNGQLIKQFNSNGEAVPFTPAPDNVRNFFKTGVTNTFNIAFNKRNEDSDFRISYTNLTNEGIVPNTDLTRNTIYASVGNELLDDRLKIRLNTMWVNSKSGNVPNAGYDESSSVMYGWLWYPRQVPIDDLRQYWEPGQEGVQQRYVENLWVNNPWLVAMENTNSFQNNRIIANAVVSYDLTEKLQMRFRYGVDVLGEQRQYRRAPSTKGVLNGSYREDKINFSEQNAEFLIKYTTLGASESKDLVLDLSVGGNIMRQRSDILVANNPELKFFGTSPSIYTLTNARSGVLTESQARELGINSVFALATLSYKYWLYLDATFRNDWNSTLVNPIEGISGSEYSFGYPSVSLSAILSEVMDFSNSKVSFLKLRGNYALVGNGAPAYSFGNTYTPQASFGGQSIFTTNRTLADPNLTNERTRAFEVGADLRFFRNRLRFDVTYYNMLSFDQVITLPVATTSGYDNLLTNGGEISNKGFELLIGATPIKTRDFRWNVNLNVGRNRAVVESLPDVIESGRYSIVADVFPGDEGGANLEFVAQEGELFGQLYGLGFVRHPETGEIIHKDGLPMLTDEKVSAGSYQPDFRIGLYNTFTFKNWNFGFLFDGQVGGKIYSRSHALYNTGGAITNNDDPHLPLSTLDNRTVYSVSYDNNGDPVYTLEQQGGVVGPGLAWNDLDGDGEIDYDTELSENDVAVEPGGAGYTGYFYNYYGNGFNRDNIEAATYDATYFKLREIVIGYTLPKRMVEKMNVEGLRISFVGRNLLLFSNVPTIDPETYSVRNGVFVNGFESTQLPSTRTYGFNLNIKL